MIIRRETTTGSNDLKTVYRPCLIDEMLGNETVKKIIKNSLDSNNVSHTYLFTGDAGVGKTTIARIIALGLNCETNGVSSKPCLECPTCKSILNGNNMDVNEINVGQTSGKAHVEAIIKDLPMSPFSARYKVLIFDEAHELTTAAKDLLLKPLEDGYEHVYFIFCTNQPEKLKSKKQDAGEAFLDRFSIHDINRIDIEEIKNLLTNICEFEGTPYNPKVIEALADESKGVPRKAIVWLDEVIKEASWNMEVIKEMCKLVGEEDNPQVFTLSKSLNSGNFKEALDLYDKIKTVSIESMRIMVASYFVGCLKRARLGGDAMKYSKILDVITTPIYEVGKLAEHKWINYMFKITYIINTSRGGKA
jgi:DNA polymerase-3 subunit gamma/tau